VKTPTDEQLLADVVRNRPDSFELLVRRHNAELFRFVLRFTNNTVAAEDVVQEAFLQAYLSAASFDASRRFKPWLFTIAANKARDWLRSRMRRSEVPLDAEIGSAGGAQTFLDLMSSDEESPEIELDHDDQRRAVRRVIAEMPPLLREVLVLAYYHRFPYREIAEILDIPVGTVKSRLHAAVGHFGRAYRSESERLKENER